MDLKGIWNVHYNKIVNMEIFKRYPTGQSSFKKTGFYANILAITNPDGAN